MKTLTLKGMSDRWGQVIRENSNVIYNIGIRNGLAGFALFFHYRAERFSEQKDTDTFYGFFEECINRFNRGYKHEAWLFDITDLIYLIKETNTQLSKVYDIQALLNQLVDSLAFGMKKLLEHQIFDPFVGAFYPAFCFMSEYPRHPSVKILRDTLVQYAQIDHQGDLYFNSRFSDDKVYLSIGHGISAYIVFLSNYLEVHPDDLEVKSLLDSFLKFLINQKNKTDFRSFFGDFVGDKSITSLSLCYGDCGIIYALIRGSKITQNTLIYNVALKMATLNGRRAVKSIKTQNDISLLYGASGMHLYFDLMAKICSDEFSQEVGTRWKNKTYELLSTDLESQISMDKSRLFKLMSFQEGITGAICSCLSDNKALFLKMHYLN